MTDPHEAFAEAYRANRVRLARVAFAMCGDARIAEDVVADALAKVWPRVRDRRVDDVAAYMRRAVVNEMIGRFRRRSHEESAYRRHGTGAVTTAADRGPDWLVWDAVQRLPVAQRAVLVLRFLEDLSEADTAAVLGVPVGTVKSRLSRGLDALRQLLEEVDVNG